MDTTYKILYTRNRTPPIQRPSVPPIAPTCLVRHSRRRRLLRLLGHPPLLVGRDLGSRPVPGSDVSCRSSQLLHVCSMGARTEFTARDDGILGEGEPAGWMRVDDLGLRPVSHGQCSYVANSLEREVASVSSPEARRGEQCRRLPRRAQRQTGACSVSWWCLSSRRAAGLGSATRWSLGARPIAAPSASVINRGYDTYSPRAVEHADAEVP